MPTGLVPALPVSQATSLLRRPPLDGCPTYNAAGWKENKIDYRNCVSSTGDDEVATSRNKPTLTVLTGAPMQLGSARNAYSNPNARHEGPVSKRSPGLHAIFVSLSADDPRLKMGGKAVSLHGHLRKHRMQSQRDRPRTTLPMPRQDFPRAGAASWCRESARSTASAPAASTMRSAPASPLRRRALTARGGQCRIGFSCAE